MAESEGVLSFDFEGGLDAESTNPAASIPVVHSDSFAVFGNHAATNSLSMGAPAESVYTGGAMAGNPAAQRSYRKTVCRHWLRGLCMKGDSCGFLHQYDKSKMPVCRFFRLYGDCREQECMYKHITEDVKECNMYKLGFCPNGPDCRYRHAKLPGPPPSVEEILPRLQQRYNYAQNKFFQQRNAVPQQTTEQFQDSQAQNTFNHDMAGNILAGESLHGNVPQQVYQQHSLQVNQQQPQQAQQSQQQLSQADRIALPLPQGETRFVQNPNVFNWVM